MENWGSWSEKEVGEKLKKGCWSMAWEKGLLGRILFEGSWAQNHMKVVKLGEVIIGSVAK